MLREADYIKDEEADADFVTFVVDNTKVEVALYYNQARITTSENETPAGQGRRGNEQVVIMKRDINDEE